jgi:hypothetical protein
LVADEVLVKPSNEPPLISRDATPTDQVVREFPQQSRQRGRRVTQKLEAQS